MRWIHNNLDKIALICIIVCLLWIAFGPLIVTSYSIVNFGGKENNTGQIGDTIGGITAPVVGLISVILLYFTLVKQIENNRASNGEANFRIIYEETAILKRAADQFSYQKQTGKNAFFH